MQIPAANRVDFLDREVNVLALVRGGERYVFLWSDENRAEMLRTLGRHASNPALGFTWYDAAVLSQRMREMHAPSLERNSERLAASQEVQVEYARPTKKHGLLRWLLGKFW